MKIRELIYRYMSDEFLKRRVDMLYKEIDIAKDSIKRMKLIDENTDILRALLYKRRNDKVFIETVQNDLNKSLLYVRKRV